MKTEVDIKEMIKSLEADIVKEDTPRDYFVDPMAVFRNSVRMSGIKFLEWVLEDA